MYAPVTPIVPVVPVAQRTRAVWPLAAICCLALLGFLIAATIVLALIPVYLPSRKAAFANGTSTSNNFYVQYQATPSSLANSLTGTVTNAAAVGTLAGVGNNGQFISGAAQAGSSRRRRGILNLREKRALQNNFYFQCQPTFQSSCTSQSCRTGVVNLLQQQIRQKGNINGAPVTVLNNGTSQTVSYNLVFVGFSTTMPSGFATTSSSTFTAAQTGLFGNGTTWVGGVAPYGNATVIIPAGITVTIPGPTLDVAVSSFTVSGTLAVGQGSSTFQFLYPTFILIQTGGTFQDLTTSKTIGTATNSQIVNNGGNTVVGSTVVTTATGTSTLGKRAIGDTFVVLVTSITITVVEIFRVFPIITPYCGFSGSILSPLSYFGGYVPTTVVCNTNGCGLFVPFGIILNTVDLGGRSRMRFDLITIAAGATFQMGTPGASGFVFGFPPRIDVSGTFAVVMSSGQIQAFGGIAFNLFGGAVFVASFVVQFATLSASGVVLGFLSISPGATGPLFSVVGADGSTSNPSSPGGTSNSPGAGSTGGGATTAAGGGATTAAAAGATTATESAESGEAEGTTPMFTG